MSVVSSIENPKTNLNKITFDDGKVLYLIGTAHVSGDSVKFVEECINEFEPDTVAVELDKNRMDALKNRRKFEETGAKKKFMNRIAIIRAMMAFCVFI